MAFADLLARKRGLEQSRLDLPIQQTVSTTPEQKYKYVVQAYEDTSKYGVVWTSKDQFPDTPEGEAMARQRAEQYGIDLGEQHRVKRLQVGEIPAYEVIKTPSQLSSEEDARRLAERNRLYTQALEKKYSGEPVSQTEERAYQQLKSKPITYTIGGEIIKGTGESLVMRGALETKKATDLAIEKQKSQQERINLILPRLKFESIAEAELAGYDVDITPRSDLGISSIFPDTRQSMAEFKTVNFTSGKPTIENFKTPTFISQGRDFEKGLSEKEIAQRRRLENQIIRTQEVTRAGEKLRTFLGLQKGLENIRGTASFLAKAETTAYKYIPKVFNPVPRLPERVRAGTYEAILGSPFFVADFATRIPEWIMKSSTQAAAQLIPSTRTQAAYQERQAKAGAKAEVLKALVTPETYGYALGIATVNFLSSMKPDAHPANEVTLSKRQYKVEYPEKPTTMTLKSSLIKMFESKRATLKGGKRKVTKAEIRKQSYGYVKPTNIQKISEGLFFVKKGKARAILQKEYLPVKIDGQTRIIDAGMTKTTYTKGMAYPLISIEQRLTKPTFKRTDIIIQKQTPPKIIGLGLDEKPSGRFRDLATPKKEVKITSITDRIIGKKAYPAGFGSQMIQRPKLISTGDIQVIKKPKVVVPEIGKPETNVLISQDKKIIESITQPKRQVILQQPTQEKIFGGFRKGQREKLLRRIQQKEAKRRQIMELETPPRTIGASPFENIGVALVKSKKRLPLVILETEYIREMVPIGEENKAMTMASSLFQPPQEFAPVSSSILSSTSRRGSLGFAVGASALGARSSTYLSNYIAGTSRLSKTGIASKSSLLPIFAVSNISGISTDLGYISKIDTAQQTEQDFDLGLDLDTLQIGALTVGNAYDVTQPPPTDISTPTPRPPTTIKFIEPIEPIEPIPRPPKEEPPKEEPEDIPPIIPIPKVKSTQSFIGGGKQKGYDVYVKEKLRKIKKGRYQSRGFRKVNKQPLAREEALGLGAGIVDEYANRSFRIKETKKLVERKRNDLINKWQALSGKFTASKKNPNVLVEKSLYAIDSYNEKMGIPFEAIKQRKRQAFINARQNIMQGAVRRARSNARRSIRTNFLTNTKRSKRNKWL